MSTRTFVRAGHGQGAGRPHVEVPPHDELPAGIPAEETGEPPATDPGPAPLAVRDERGRFLPGQGTREIGARGGRPRGSNSAVKWGKALRLGGLLKVLEDDQNLAPLIRESQRWYRTKVREVAAAVGGGVASAGVVSVLKTAAWQRAFSSALFELAAKRAYAWRVEEVDGKKRPEPRFDLVAMASKLGNDSRQNLLAAHSLAALEAAANREAEKHGGGSGPLPPWYVQDEANDDEAKR